MQFSKIVKSILLVILLLTIVIFPALAGVSVSSWAKDPVVRFVATSYLMQPESMTELQKSLAVISHLESAVLGGRKIPIQSFEEYLARRDQIPSTIQEYQKSIQHNGLVNPLNITTANSEVFEKIVEFEVRYIQRLLESSWPANLNQGHDMIIIRQSLQSLLSVYQLGLGFRDRIDSATQSWEGVFGLGLLRSVGKNLVNPMVRSVIYSDSVLNRLRNELRNRFAQAQGVLVKNFDVFDRDFQSHGKLMIESILANDVAGLEVMKPFRNLDASLIFNLMQSYVKTMPLEMKQELAWTFLQSPPDQPMAFVAQYPKQLDLINHFLNWIQSDTVRHQVKALHPLPLWEMARAMALLLRENLIQKELIPSMRVLGEFTKRNWLGGREASVKITLERKSEVSSQHSMYTLAAFESRFPELAEFVKKRIADVVINNAFGFGLRSKLSDFVRIKIEKGSKDITVQLFSEATVVEHPLDRADRFIDDLSRVVSLEFLSSAANIKNIKEFDWNDIYEKQTPENQQKLNRFLADPENLRWGLQMYQLKKIVGEDIIRNQMKIYFLKRPNLVMAFIYKKWKQRSGSISVQSNQCFQFYAQ
ncbi:MAG: hypothetical protein JNM24_06275 [Bdellovibrionaceae bacterium]|nr:hypothetical protein [Pseudobdellovibrionaceae bacterium]